MSSEAAVGLCTVIVMLSGYGRCGWMVGRADGNSRVPKEVDEEEACSEFWVRYWRVVQSR